MLRKSVALGALALAGALLVVSDPSSARGGGMRAGFAHGARGSASILRQPRVNLLPAGWRAKALHVRHAVIPHVPHNFARTTVRAPFVHLTRRSHGAYIYGSSYPITGDDESAYFGMPYDPGVGIPVYGPAPSIQQIDPPAAPIVPRLSGVRDELREACSSERVTVPAGEGEREIIVVRC